MSDALAALGDRYAVTGELGRGGMAVVHLGDRDAFFRWMHRGLDVRDPYGLALAMENLWDAARADPR